MKHSAGIIPYRRNHKGDIEYFVGHPGGNKYNYWALLKGEVEDGEDLASAAIREFKEETGLELDWLKPSNLTPLGSVIQSVHKKVTAFALNYGSIIPENCFSNMADNCNWPEIDEYRWMTFAELKDCTHPTHLCFYKLLENALEIN